MERRGFGRNAILVGSVAKGTYLKNPDIDIFLRFPTHLTRTQLKELGLEIGKSILPAGYTRYAEHPYWHGVYEGFEVDIVPCYLVDSPQNKMSAVDRTPFHTEYVMKNLKEWQRDEVRILKAFLKGIGAYGAEAKIQGFSGYLTELLILRYGDFLSTLRNVARWRRRVHLSLEGEGKKFREPVVFIDPVDPDRNAASAVSEDKKSLFIYAAQKYLEAPNLRFFFPREIVPLTEEELRSRMEMRDTHFYAFVFPRPEIVEDNLYPQMRRTLEILLEILRDFHPLNSFSYVGEERVYLVIELERESLPKVKKHQGPPVWHENSKDFLSQWSGKALRGPYIEGYRWFADVPRKLRTVEEIVRREIKNYKLGKYFELKKEDMKIERLEKIMDELNPQSLTAFFEPKFPWER